MRVYFDKRVFYPLTKEFKELYNEETNYPIFGLIAIGMLDTLLLPVYLLVAIRIKKGE